MPRRNRNVRKRGIHRIPKHSAAGKSAKLTRAYLTPLNLHAHHKTGAR